MRQFERDHGHVEGEHRHPAGGVGLLELVAERQWLRAVEHRNIVEAEKAALENIVALGVLAVDPPGVIEQELVKDALQEIVVAAPALHALGAERLQRGKGVDRRVHVAEIPLVGRDLAVRIEIAFVEHQLDLILGEIDVDQGERAAVEGEVPGGEPGIFPGVGHRDHVGRLHVLPRLRCVRAGAPPAAPACPPKASARHRSGRTACSTPFRPRPGGKCAGPRVRRREANRDRTRSPQPRAPPAPYRCARTARRANSPTRRDRAAPVRRARG